LATILKVNKVEGTAYFRAGISTTETNGVEVGYPLAIDANGDYVKASQANGLKASTIVYESSKVSPFDAYNPNPQGVFKNKNYESRRLGKLKKFVVEFADSTGAAVSVFRTSNATLTGTVATNKSTTVTGTDTKFTTELKVGDYIVIAGETVRQVSGISSDTSLTVSVACSTTANDKTVTVKSQLDAPIYLGNATGKFSLLGKPYTLLKPVTGDGLSQCIGYVETKNTFVLDLKIEPNPLTI